MSAQLTAVSPESEEHSVKPTIFSLKTPMISAGTIENYLCDTDLMRVSLKIYKEGGENFLHTHQLEDHFFVVLDGKGRFRDPSGHEVTLGKYQGIMLPRGSYYMFTSVGDVPLVLLRSSATSVYPRVKDSRKWWEGVVETRRSGDKGKHVIPGEFFAPDSELDSKS